MEWNFCTHTTCHSHSYVIIPISTGSPKPFSGISIGIPIPMQNYIVQFCVIANLVNYTGAMQSYIARLAFLFIAGDNVSRALVASWTLHLCSV